MSTSPVINHGVGFASGRKIMPVKGFVFDFDGLILDTETPLFEVYRELFAEYGVEITLRQWWRIIGTGHSEYDPIAHLVQISGDHKTASDFNKLVYDRVDQRLKKMEPFPGVTDFIQEASRLKIPMAVASSSSREWVFRHLDRLQLTPYFQHVLTLDDVNQPKPNPELYLLAASRLNIDTGNLVAFEDSLNGIEAAKAAGMFCIAVPNDITREMQLDEADAIVNSFIDLDIQQVLMSEMNKSAA